MRRFVPRPGPGESRMKADADARVQSAARPPHSVLELLAGGGRV